MAPINHGDTRVTDQFDPEVFWQQHRTKLIAGIVVIVALGLSLLVWQRGERAASEAASAQLAAATDTAALQDVANRYRGKEQASEALLRLADLHYAAGRYAESIATYDSFLQQYPRHPVAEAARFARAAVMEAAGDLQGASAQYSQIVGVSGQQYTALAAKTGLARCAEALGRQLEARRLYEELMAVAQGSPWQAEIYLRWLVLGREQQPASEMQTGTPQRASTSGDTQAVPLDAPGKQK
jgi:tetratricopeptide (TPR) repeat protein